MQRLGVMHSLWVVLAAVWASASAQESAPATQRAPFELAPPASTPVKIDKPAMGRVILTVAGRSEPGYYWLRLPPGYGPGRDVPLLIALHGTDDTAQEMIDFWSARSARVPMIIAAPEAIGTGWGNEDLPTIRSMLTNLREWVWYDRERVLLAGFSAGGAMGFHLLYKERVPVSAVVALANYVPPSIKAEEVEARRHLPVFYAVGMADVNHERMREGIQWLRRAGGNVDLYRPRIGHTLDAGVGQAALDWFFDQCARRVEAIVAGTSSEDDLAELAVALERIVGQSRWHEPVHVTRAAEALERLEAPGRRQLDAARGLVSARRGADAAEILRKVEASHGGGRLGREARRLRLEVEADPGVQAELARRATQQRADDALRMYAGAQRLVADGKMGEAADRCRRIIELYGDTPAAVRARNLLNILEVRTSP